MLRVLRHYLPLRKALLILSETVILSLALLAWTTLHLWEPSDAVRIALARALPEAYNAQTAAWMCLRSSILLAVLAQLAISFNELYDVRISGSRFHRAARFVESAGSSLALLLVITWLAHVWKLQAVLDFPPLSLGEKVKTLVFGLLSGFLALYLWRGLFHWALSSANFGQRTLILGSGRAAHQLAREMIERPDAGYDLVALIEEPNVERIEQARATADTGTRPRLILSGTYETQAQRQDGVRVDTRTLVLPPLSERTEELLTIARERTIDLIVVALQDRRALFPTDALLACRLAGVEVREHEALYEQITGKIAVEALRPSYLIFNEGFRHNPWNELGKRLLDVSVALVMLAFSWPLMILTALAVRLDSHGPALFSQERVGRDGKPFTLYKFRSMRTDAETRTGPVWATENDPRITRVGRFIRKSRLDELPQLFNVLAGSMSLVGPRPERAHFVDDLATKIPYFRQRHLVKPGLTGWAQINYRYGASFEDAVQKLQYDLFYIKNQSLLFDLSILFNTVKIVLLRKGT